MIQQSIIGNGHNVFAGSFQCIDGFLLVSYHSNLFYLKNLRSVNSYDHPSIIKLFFSFSTFHHELEKCRYEPEKLGNIFIHYVSF